MNKEKFKSINFIRKHYVQLMNSKERTPLERVLSFSSSSIDFAHNKNFTIFGDLDNDRGYRYIKYNNNDTFESFLSSYDGDIALLLIYYSSLVSNDLEFNKLIKDLVHKYYKNYENIDHSDLIMAIEMCCTKGKEFKKLNK